MFFSVIIPTYNRKHLLKRSIESVIKQSFNDFELIVVDDGSSDGTSDFVRENYPKVILIEQDNHGVSHARNRGIERSSGEWICFLDSDDEWLAHKLEKQFQFINEHKGLRLIHGEERWVRNGVRVNQKLVHKKGGGDQFCRSVDLCIISPSTVCIHHTVLNEFNGFREDFAVCEDYDLWLKITAKYPVGFIEDELIIKYGGHDDQLSSSMHAMDYYRVLSLIELLEETYLECDKKNYALSSIDKRVAVLEKGALKHHNKALLLKLDLLKDRRQMLS